MLLIIVSRIGFGYPPRYLPRNYEGMETIMSKTRAQMFCTIFLAELVRSMAHKGFFHTIPGTPWDMSEIHRGGLASSPHSSRSMLQSSDQGPIAANAFACSNCAT